MFINSLRTRIRPNQNERSANRVAQPYLFSKRADIEIRNRRRRGDRRLLIKSSGLVEQQKYVSTKRILSISPTTRAFFFSNDYQPIRVLTDGDQNQREV